LHEAEKKEEIEKMNETAMELNMSKSFADEMLTSREKITFALELAIAEITKKKAKREAGEEEDEEVQDEKDLAKKRVKAGFLGVNSAIKLPFVIGTPEFNGHPFAGIVNVGSENE
jgi:hypothetical protein